MQELGHPFSNQEHEKPERTSTDEDDTKLSPRSIEHLENINSGIQQLIDDTLDNPNNTNNRNSQGVNNNGGTDVDQPQ